MISLFLEVSALQSIFRCFLVCLAFVVSGCAQKPPKPLQEYRLYVVSDSDAQPRVRSSYFYGQLTQVPLRALGDLSAFSQDNAGNRVSPLLVRGGHLMSAVVKDEAVNLLSEAEDGTLVSSIDFDGDRVVDLVDTRFPDRDRFIVANRLGRAFIERWLDGLDPFCSRFRSLNLPSAFGCDDSGASGGPGGTGASSGARGLADPFADICADYDGASPAKGMPNGVFAHGGHGWGRLRAVGTQTAGHNVRDADGNVTGMRLWYTIGARVNFDDAGNHVSTYREVRYWDAERNLVRTIEERVDHEGNGTRTVTDHNADGSRTTRTSRFSTSVNSSNGTYPVDPAMNDRDAPDEHKDYYEDADGETRNSLDGLKRWPDEVTGASGAGGTETHPGDVNDSIDGGWDLWCGATEPGTNPSGLESVVETDHGVFDAELCLASEARGGDTCVALDPTVIYDIDRLLAPPRADHNCGRFEEPGPDGTCGPATSLDMLGNHLRIDAMKVEDVEICNPLVCNPDRFVSP